MKIKISQFLTLSLTFTLLVLFLMLFQNGKKVVSQWGQSVELTAYLSNQVTDTEKQEIEDYLKAQGQISKVQFVSRKEAYQKFQAKMTKYISDTPASVDVLKVIPESFQVSLNPNIPSHELESQLLKLETTLKEKFTRIESLSYGQEWVQNYIRFFNAIASFGLTIILTLVLGSAFILYGTLLSAYQSKKLEIEILNLVGASYNFISRPFYSESLKLTIASLVMGLGLSYGVFQLLKRVVFSQLDWLPLSQQFQFVSGFYFFVVAGTAIFISFISTWMFLNKVLAESEPA